MTGGDVQGSSAGPDKRLEPWPILGGQGLREQPSAPPYSGLLLCEGPFWDTATGRLSWVDIDGGTLHVSDGRGYSVVQLDDTLGAAIPVAGSRDQWIAANGDTIALVGLDTASETLWQGRRCCKHGRFNDAGCDPRGRLFVGRICSVGAHAGDLVRLDPERALVIVLSDIALANGMCWSPDGRTMYFVDSRRRTLTAYDYDFDDGTPSRPRLVRAFDGPAQPDGLAIDTEGGVWVAMWGGSAILRLSPDGDLDRKITLGHRFPTSCAFGGPRLDTLFVTFAEDPDKSRSGFVSRLDVGFTGAPQHRYSHLGLTGTTQ